ncbi:MAG: hypothetical protein A2Y17_10980 [Clostridiales bacterium GWF2_38_85]|nr:MAG: hypothetical protein A2Y17_10980 [Clostridiales bacterium GWF2_38_85]
MKTCISTYSFYKAIIKGELDHFGALEKTKAMGVGAIEFVLGDTTLDGSSSYDFCMRLAEHARKLKLDTPIYTTGANFLCADVQKEIARVEKHVDIASAAGIKLMRHDIATEFYPGYTDLRTFDAILPQVTGAIREVAAYAESKGVITCSENHGHLVQDSDRMLAVFHAVNHPNYKYLCDIGNFGGVDEDCAVAVSKLLPLIVHVHAKDAFRRSGMLPNPGAGWSKTRAGNYRRATILGHGDVPTYQCLETINQSGYNGYVSLEFEGIEDNLTALQISIDNLNRYIEMITK